MVSIDPGLRGIGVACWVNGELMSAEYIENTEATVRGAPAWLAMGEAARLQLVVSEVLPVSAFELVIEGQQIYAPNTRRKDLTRYSWVNPNDLLEVAGAAGAVMSAIQPASVVTYLPREWTHGEAKPERHAQLEADLEARGHGEYERIIFPRLKGLRHNVLDAVALGLFHLTKGGERRCF